MQLGEAARLQRRAGAGNVACAIEGAALMGRRGPQSALKRAREQAKQEKRELKQAKKDARAAERRAAEPPAPSGEQDARGS